MQIHWPYGMFAQVVPYFQDALPFNVVTSVYGPAGDLSVATGVSAPTVADPKAQGVIAILALAVNVVALTIIIRRAILQKKNPYTHEIFTDQKDFQEAMLRRE